MWYLIELFFKLLANISADYRFLPAPSRYRAFSRETDKKILTVPTLASTYHLEGTF
jgi:hypothetical protein